MIPALEDVDPNYPWQILPVGVHDTTLVEIEARFATTPHRQMLFSGLKRVAEDLKGCGVAELYVDGSFTTSKPHPEDFDGCWNADNVDITLVMLNHPVLLDFSSERAGQKAKYFGEMFLADNDAAPGLKYLDFFQSTHGRVPKGILRVKL
jgi:hypothetical protein